MFGILENHGMAARWDEDIDCSFKKTTVRGSLNAKVAVNYLVSQILLRIW